MAVDALPLPSGERGSRRVRRLTVGATLVGLFAASAVLAPWLAPYDPTAVPAALSEVMLRPPEPAHLFGTDALARDLFSRVLHGGRVSLALGLGVEVVAATLGVAVGLLAGYHGGWRDSLLMRATDVVMAFPSLILAIGLIAVFERPGLDKVALVLVALGWTTIARVVRGEILSLKERDYVQAARALGVGHGTILVRHLLPNAVGPDHRRGHHRRRQQHDRRGRALVPRPRRPVPHDLLGQHARRRPDLPRLRPLGRLLPRRRAVARGAGDQLLGDALRDLLDPRWRD